jgi:HNH endonuclease
MGEIRRKGLRNGFFISASDSRRNSQGGRVMSDDDSLVEIVEGPLATPCWLFGAGEGYGMIYYQGRYQGMHRVSWQINRGCSIPSGMVICHHCDMKACFNPKHLFAGTQLDNMRDWAIKYRQRSVNWSSTTRPRRHSASRCRRLCSPAPTR